MKRPFRIWIALPMFLALFQTLSACSSQQFYNVGQAWQRTECNKIQDSDERARCMKSADTHYDTYQQQSQDVQTSPKP